MVDDPFYQDGPFQWTIPKVEAITGHRVQVGECLGSTVIAIDSPGKRIRIRPGLTMFQAAGALMLGAWRAIGGHDWAPQFRVRPTLRALPGCRATITRLQRCPTCQSLVRGA